MLKSPPQCLNINECQKRISGCDLNAFCHDTPGGWECECFIGFQGDGTNCANIDECLINTDECGPHSTCIDTVGPAFHFFSLDPGYFPISFP